MFDNTISIPLVIENRNGKVIKQSYLNLGIKSVNGYDRIVTGAIHEGTYRFELKKSNVSSIRSYKDEKYDDAKWEEVVDQLLLYDKFQSKCEDLIMTAKFVSDEKNYDEDGDLVEDFQTVNDYITVDIKTNGTLSRLYGSFQLKEVDDATDLLYWLKEVVDLKDEMLMMYSKINNKYESVVKERDEFKTALDDNIDNHDKILQDLERKFYLVLDSKKRRIIQLTQELNKDDIEGLNEIYEESQKNNLDNLLKNKHKLPEKLDDIYVSPRKRKANSDISPRKSKMSDGELTKKILDAGGEDDSEAEEGGEGGEDGSEDEVGSEKDNQEDKEEGKGESIKVESQQPIKQEELIKQEKEELIKQEEEPINDSDTIYSTSEDENPDIKQENQSDNTIYSESE